LEVMGMKKALFGVLFLVAGLSLAQGVDYRREAQAAMALARLQTVAQQVSGEEKLLTWAKEVKARAEKSYEAKNPFKAFREAQAALALFRAAQGEAPKAGLRGPSRTPAERAFGLRPGEWGMGRPHGLAPGRRGQGQDPALRLKEMAQRSVDRAEKELDYYRGQDPLVKTLIAEAKNRLEKEPYRASLLARAALALISAERGF
jgi:type II secretory pathway pseudopilin PulG